MCGINGFTFPDKEIIAQMNKVIRHRGPDDEGSYVDSCVSLGNVRLAIIDISSKGHMPMTDVSSRYVITFNGEIYNFKQLREKLINKGYKFRSHSDTEVVLYLFIEYGEKAIGMLNGMFALAIWDKAKQKLILARDRVGIKPLYYFYDNQKFIFSSEIKSILCHKIDRGISKDAFDLYMRIYFIPAPLTIYKNVFKVVPGEMLIWQNNTIVKKRYWEISDDVYKDDKNKCIEEIKDALLDSVAKQLVADRPVGLFLSGGIDSNILLGIASKIKKSPIKTYSVGFCDIDEEDKFNADFLLARQSAAYFNSDHHEYVLSPREALNSFKSLIGMLDEPISNPTHIPTYYLAKMAVKDVTVVLGGDCGDELFGGYDRYWSAKLLDLYSYIPKIIRENITNTMIYNLKPNSSHDLLRRLKAKTLAEKYLVFLGSDEEELKKIYTSNYDKAVKNLSSLQLFDKQEKFHKIFPQLDFSHWLPEESLMRSDKMTMLSGLEQRVPFLDNNLINLAYSIPFAWKVGRKMRKIILRKAYGELLPQFILSAPKRGFFSPAAKWLRNKEWQDYVEEKLSSKNLDKLGIFNNKAVQDMYRKHLSKEKYNLQLIWAVLTFVVWAESNKLD